MAGCSKCEALRRKLAEAARALAEKIKNGKAS